jgi:hypothetical protein
MLQGWKESCFEHLQRYAATGAVFNEQPPVDLSLINAALLIPAMYDVRSARRLLQNANLILSATAIVILYSWDDLFKRSLVKGVVDGQGAVHGKSKHKFIERPSSEPM